MDHGTQSPEVYRLHLQSELDSAKTQAERNRLGQFSTPNALAVEMLQLTRTFFANNDPVHFLDPAIGTGVFYSALLTTFPKNQIVEAVGFEIDPHYEEPTRRLWSHSQLVLNLGDFTTVEPLPRYNLIICNPPYIRHHFLKPHEKKRLQEIVNRLSGMKMSGLAGLYCYFLMLSSAWMVEGGIGCWLIPSEFMDVNYGRTVKSYLLSDLTLIRIHRFDPLDVQFSDALVSSTVIWFRKSIPARDHSVRFTFGGTLQNPSLVRDVPIADLDPKSKWTPLPLGNTRLNAKSNLRLGDFFRIKRGIATGDNKFFVLTIQEILKRNLPLELFQPILPSPRYISGFEVDADVNGNPLTQPQLWILTTSLTESQIASLSPALFAYLQEGKARALPDRYLCRHRFPWYSQEKRPPAPLVCTYIGRKGTKSGKPFRFILNHSKATVANVYLAMYPTPKLSLALERNPTLMVSIWQTLNTLPADHLLQAGRVYGGGLHKLEPLELANLDATAIATMIQEKT